ncbi:DMT family transporter [Falsihalocynthiibacter sp. SS001]|uniref:DMT family transporter n=1 Tax=Falsihalocynthiibacter sp. SS001 TaxID=3349698 RepID=UPI0036D396EA
MTEATAHDIARSLERKRELMGHAAMLLFSLVIAGSFSFGGLVANEIAPSALNFVRFIIATLVLLLVVLKTDPAPLRSLREAAVAPWRYMISGGLIGAYMVLMFEGLKTASPVSTAAVFTISPLITAAAAYVILRQALPKRVLGALLVGGIGALWVVFRADLGALLRFEIGRGELIYFVGTCAHAVYIPLLRKFNRGESSFVYMTYTMGLGVLILFAVGAREIFATDWLDLSPIVWAVILYTGVMATALSLSLIHFGSMRLPSAKVMAYTYLVPSWVILLEIALGHGAPTGVVLVGVAVTVIALLMLLRQD